MSGGSQIRRQRLLENYMNIISRIDPIMVLNHCNGEILAHRLFLIASNHICRWVELVTKTTTMNTNCIEVLNFQLVKFMTMLLRVSTRYLNNKMICKICKIWARAHIYCCLYVCIWYYMYTCRYVYFCMYFVWRTDF